MEYFAAVIVEDEDIRRYASAIDGRRTGCISVTAKRNNSFLSQVERVWSEVEIAASWCACTAFSLVFWGSLVWLIKTLA